MDTTQISKRESKALTQYLHQLSQTHGLTPNTPEYALVAAKLALQFACGGQVIAYRLVCSSEADGFRAKYQILDDQGGTFDDVRARLAGRSDIQTGDVEIDYIEPLDDEPTTAYEFETISQPI